MLFQDPGVEVSRQSVPLTAELTGGGALTESVPLHQLGDYGPASLPSDYDPEAVTFSFSNDESAAYFDQTRVRTALPEYQEASNRVALLIGESSLAAALPYIPEETILVVDQSPAMCSFMSRYIAGLREAETPSEWGEFMGFNPSQQPDEATQMMIRRVFEQVKEWHATGYDHPLNDGDAYGAVHELAREKAIIPWQADISKRRDMKRLGKVLRAHDANVTMMNLTNVLACRGPLKHAKDYVTRLSHLPVTPHAPILMTTTMAKRGPGPFGLGGGYIVEATGPFFGLDNLKQHGGAISRGAGGSAVERQYMRSGRMVEGGSFEGVDVLSGLMAALQGSGGLPPNARGIVIDIAISEEGIEIKGGELPGSLKDHLRDLFS